jgi:hypothetical protein
VFHANCDAFDETVSIAENSLGYTFGGYAMGSWSVETCLTNGGTMQWTGCYDTTLDADFVFRLEPG